MATTQVNTLQPTNSTNAHYRAWTKFMRDAMVAGGWVQTTDTGQIDFATQTKPTLPSQDAGFVVMRMNDVHQALRPVFVRLTYGSAPLDANIPRVGIGIGTGSDGAGNLTGGVGSSTIRLLSESSAATNCFSYSSADTGRAQIIMFDQVLNTNLTMHFSIERGRNSAGAIDRDLIYFVHSGPGGGGTLTDSHVLHMNGGSSGVAQTAICSVIAPGLQRAQQENYGVGLVLPIGAGPVVMRPATGYIITSSNDWVNGAIMDMYVHGQLVTYRRTQNCRVGLTNVSGSNHIVWVRYD